MGSTVKQGSTEGDRIRKQIDNGVLGDLYLLSRDQINKLIKGSSPSPGKKKKVTKHRRELSENPTHSVLHKPILHQKREA